MAGMVYRAMLDASTYWNLYQLMMSKSICEYLILHSVAQYLYELYPNTLTSVCVRDCEIRTTTTLFPQYNSLAHQSLINVTAVASNHLSIPHHNAHDNHRDSALPLENPLLTFPPPAIRSENGLEPTANLSATHRCPVLDSTTSSKQQPAP